MRRLRQIHASLPYWVWPRVADIAAFLASWRAARTLSGEIRTGVLLDSTVLSHAITHEEAWIDTGTKLWGGTTPVRTGYAARIPVHSRQNKTREYRDICSLIGLAHLARRNRLQLYTSAELMCEQDRHPPARFRYVTYSGFSLFDGISIEPIDDWNFDALVHGERDPKELARIQRERLGGSNEALFHKLVEILGQKHSQDAWHICTAERHELFAYLTMDYKLLAAIDSQHVRLGKLGLKAMVVSPQRLAKKFRISSVSPNLFSYTGASFPVRSDLCIRDQRRRVRPVSKTGESRQVLRVKDLDDDDLEAIQAAEPSNRTE